MSFFRWKKMLFFYLIFELHAFSIPTIPTYLYIEIVFNILTSETFLKQNTTQKL